MGKQLEVEVADGVPTHRERTKRCACNSLLDSECHYFCHLDIIWVNTPRWAWGYNNKHVWKHTCSMHYVLTFFCVWSIVIGLIKYTAQNPGCRKNTCWCYHCIIKEAVVPSVSKSKVCGMFMLMTLPFHSKTTVYGLGGALSRRKRSTFRCTCANPDDQTCSNFCHHRWVRAQSSQGSIKF